MQDNSPQKTQNPDQQLPIDLKTPDGNVTLLRLTQAENPETIISSLNMEKIPHTDELSRFLGTIPSIAAATALNQSFRIVMPAGVAGSLMTLSKNPAMSGLFTTSVVGETGKIVGTAGLASMSAFVAPMVVWTILAFITGQFFLTQIHRNIQSVFEELRNILFFLVAQEESDLRARIEFLGYVSYNFRALYKNSETRSSTLTNLQKTNIESLASLKLWTYNIKKQLDDIKETVDLVKQRKDKNRNTEKVVQLITETRLHINRAVASWQCYSLGIAMEIQLGSNFDRDLLQYIKDSINKQSDELKSSLFDAENIWNDIRNISHFNESPLFKAGDFGTVAGEVKQFLADIDISINSTNRYIDMIETLETKGVSLLYYNQSFYRPT